MFQAANRDATTSLDSIREARSRHQEEVARLTTGIRRIIEVMKTEDLLSEDVKDEYRQLVREKERLVTLCEKLQLDIEVRQKRVLDVEVIQQSLRDFERLVSLLSLEDQKELSQLLIRQIEVYPYDPSSDEPPTGAGALATKVRSKWYRVNLALHQLLGVNLSERVQGAKFG